MGTDSQGSLTTRPVRFQGQHLFVNHATSGGGLRVEAIAADGSVAARSETVSGDRTREAIRWEGGGSLEGLKGQPVRFRFHLSKGRLYAFWVSPDPEGASYGYLGGGSPEARGVRDLP